jgi:hypothetical protein
MPIAIAVLRECADMPMSERMISLDATPRV